MALPRRIALAKICKFPSRQLRDYNYPIATPPASQSSRENENYLNLMKYFPYKARGKTNENGSKKIALNENARLCKFICCLELSRVLCYQCRQIQIYRQHFKSRHSFLDMEIESFYKIRKVPLSKGISAISLMVVIFFFMFVYVYDV